MATRPADELFYDSQATLRLVDDALDGLRVSSAGRESATTADAPGRHAGEPMDIGLPELPQILLRAYAEISNVLNTLRRSRDVLEATTVQKLQQTNDKLREVSSATEVAATDMLDGLDRSLAMVDELDANAGSDEPERAGEVRNDLRNELFSLMNCLQFQDITTQQLNYASSVLVEMEHRLAELAEVFDPRSFGIATEGLVLSPMPVAAFDPAATTTDAEKRQAVVDEIFGQG